VRLEGRKALVTGGASGIGAATVRRLAAEGADVVSGDVNADGAAEVAAEVGAAGVHLDVTDPASSVAVAAEHGPFQILVNNAGTDEFGFFADTDPGVWERVIAINLIGVMACTHAVLPGMQEGGYGRIVNISSEAGRIGSKGSVAYSSAKGGVLGFTKAFAREGARFGITANAICPGPIETPLLMQALEFGEIGQKIIDNMKAGTQLRRMGTPDEIASVVAFLASDDSSYMTGETLGVSGGMGMC
jgi:2-hydroxycyclohexanecarboxyl-CoA dehydrogenase